MNTAVHAHHAHVSGGGPVRWCLPSCFVHARDISTRGEHTRGEQSDDVAAVSHDRGERHSAKRPPYKQCPCMLACDARGIRDIEPRSHSRSAHSHDTAVQQRHAGRACRAQHVRNCTASGHTVPSARTSPAAGSSRGNHQRKPDALPLNTSPRSRFPDMFKASEWCPCHVLFAASRRLHLHNTP